MLRGSLLSGGFSDQVYSMQQITQWISTFLSAELSVCTMYYSPQMGSLAAWHLCNSKNYSKGGTQNVCVSRRC